MIRLIACVLGLLATPGFAQNASALSEGSIIEDDGNGVALTLTLTQAVPYRLFLLDDPRRLVLDFQGLEWGRLDGTALDQAEAISGVRFGLFQPGWSRMVLDLNAPLRIQSAGLDVARRATVTVDLTPTSAAEFARDAGAPENGAWAQIAENAPDLPAPTSEDGPVTVVIDPGHGGIDPGAILGEVQEADLMLLLATELAEMLNHTGQVRALLTRETDRFVSLEGRMSMARSVNADLFISLHADSLEQDNAQGASIYTLNAKGVDAAARRMAERHERGDLLAGLDLSGQGDRVATVLMDLARAETGPQSDRFADAAVEALTNTGVLMNSRPRRDGQFAVLNAPDFAAVLVETGFLSNPQDRARLATPQGRAPIVTGLTDAVQIWAQEEAALATRLRQ